MSVGGGVRLDVVLCKGVSRPSCVVLRNSLTVSEMHKSRRTAECPSTNLKHKIFSLSHDLHILSSGVALHEDLHHYQKQL